MSSSEKFGRRRLRVGYGEQTVHETKQNADVQNDRKQFGRYAVQPTVHVRDYTHMSSYFKSILPQHE